MGPVSGGEKIIMKASKSNMNTAPRPIVTGKVRGMNKYIYTYWQNLWETDRQTDRQRQTDRDRQTDTEKELLFTVKYERQTDRHREGTSFYGQVRETDRQTDRQTDKTDKQTVRDRQKQRQRDRDRKLLFTLKSDLIMMEWRKHSDKPSAALYNLSKSLYSLLFYLQIRLTSLLLHCTVGIQAVWATFHNWRKWMGMTLAHRV